MKITPGRAIRLHCVDCMGGEHLVRDCQGDTLADGSCLFFKYRTGSGRPSVKTIRKYCVVCMGGSEKLVRECKSGGCYLHKYRFGKNEAYRRDSRPNNLPAKSQGMDNFDF